MTICSKSCHALGNISNCLCDADQQRKWKKTPREQALSEQGLVKISYNIAVYLKETIGKCGLHIVELILVLSVLLLGWRTLIGVYLHNQTALLRHGAI